MLRHIGAACVAALLTLSPASAELSGTQTYDLLFKNGTLDDISNDAALVYDRTVSNALNPDADARDTGEIRLSFDEERGSLLASLQFTQGEKYRNLGSFPASVGNPMIMYFVETVTRDMGESAGGSVFYIRNRIKEALVTPTEAVAGEAEFQGRTIPTTTVTLRPFQGDPNAQAMQGWGELEMIVTMSDEVPGWYHTLAAKAPVYSSVLRFDEVAQP
ncbi:hypothetical protein DU478_18350 [Thalassococcus profundi]|uniref:DUF3124 domain-containing protein n=1 Tax=Thalassococcus profundi TaxID=2282382 RepID=A0A369TH85_9RHOB|nr:hypothetical protein [Thalassococcus profundi]RDD64701.1 hypothetical protein DU478_18350 [Thalassococcus profundi]